MAKTAHNIILFDGVCHLCNRSVQFVITHDKKAFFKFASLQSVAAERLLAKQRFTPSREPKSILLISGNKVYSQSSAVLRIAQKLDGWPKFMVIFFIIPTFIRNFFYRIVAHNRYRWFGKSSACISPTAEMKRRFLSD